MAPAAVAVGSLAFLGPPQVPAFTEFCYVRVARIDGTQAFVTVIDPDGADDDFPEPVDVAVLKRRLVSDDEGIAWPGAFVGSPVAFIQPDGIDMDTWSYGVVSGYSMSEKGPVLHVRRDNGACKVPLQHPPNAVKVEWIDYALQSEAGASSAALNASELLPKLDEIRALFGKSRTGLPARVANALTVPFDPDALVPVIRPDTLAVVSVPRQHILDCALNRKSKRGASMFVPPHEATTARNIKRKPTANAPSSRPTSRRRGSGEMSTDESDEEDQSVRVADTNDIEDKRAVLRQHNLLGTSFLDGANQVPLTHVMTEDVRARAATAFRPTTIEKEIHDVIGHPDHQGKDPQCILEYEQQARGSLLLGTPPVLRGAYDFGFRIRGLSVMHFASISRSMMLDGAETTVNMTDFSRKNGIQPAAKEPTYLELVEALGNLRQFGMTFFNEDTVEVLRAAERFIETFGKGSAPDRDTTRRLVFWLNTKFCQFRGLVLAEGLPAALRVKAEFSLQDALLSELLYDQQKEKLAALTSKLETKPTAGNPGYSGGKDTRQSKQRGISQEVLRALPKQGSLTLCMRYLSKNGCSGNGVSGKCFSSKRAHFRPNELPAVVKEHIAKSMGGLAPEFANI